MGVVHLVIRFLESVSLFERNLSSQQPSMVFTFASEHVDYKTRLD